MSSWTFDTEFSLEEFFWNSLESLLGLKPLARQYSTKGQVCDILAVSSEKQLVILELKNCEDRYVIPQLTRYYSNLRDEQPFPEQVDYGRSVRLVAIAPIFHSHNFIDSEYSTLEFEFYRFYISKDREDFLFYVEDIQSEERFGVKIPQKFYSMMRLFTEEESSEELVPIIGRPPKSLRLLLEKLTPEQEERILSLRHQLLGFDERIAEVGLSTRTQYGLRKEKNKLFKTKLCAEFIPEYPGRYYPELFLMLPYPKKEFGGGTWRRYKKEPVKGLGWASVAVLGRTPPMVKFFLGKSRTNYSKSYTYSDYEKMCEFILGYRPKIESAEDLLSLSLTQWKENIS